VVDLLIKKIEGIAGRYADLVEKKINEAKEKDSIGSNDFSEINEGIRMLNHLAGTLQKLSTCDGNVTGTQ
jgi:hypothetical protein